MDGTQSARIKGFLVNRTTGLDASKTLNSGDRDNSCKSMKSFVGKMLGHSPNSRFMLNVRIE